MTLDDIKSKFDGQTVYRFDGSVDELSRMQAASGSSYNYMVVREVVYFVAEKAVSDSRAVAL